MPSRLSSRAWSTESAASWLCGANTAFRAPRRPPGWSWSWLAVGVVVVGAVSSWASWSCRVVGVVVAVLAWSWAWSACSAA